MPWTIPILCFPDWFSSYLSSTYRLNHTQVRTYEFSEQRQVIYQKYEGQKSKSLQTYGRREQSNCNQVFINQYLLWLIFPDSVLGLRELPSWSSPSLQQDKLVTFQFFQRAEPRGTLCATLCYLVRNKRSLWSSPFCFFQLTNMYSSHQVLFPQ